MGPLESDQGRLLIIRHILLKLTKTFQDTRDSVPMSPMARVEKYIILGDKIVVLSLVDCILRIPGPI